MGLIEVQLATLYKSNDVFWFAILDINDFGDFERSLLRIGKRWDKWVLELFFMRVLPR